MSKIKDYLYLGSLDDSNDKDFLLNNNIKTVINLTYNHDNIKQENIDYYKIDTLDNEKQPIIYVINKVINLINENKNNRNILVHCYVGKSRSATCVIGYLINEYNMTLEESIKYTKERRNIINPNNGFIKQLIIYENEKYKKINILLYVYLIFVITICLYKIM